MPWCPFRRQLICWLYVCSLLFVAGVSCISYVSQFCDVVQSADLVLALQT